MFDDRLSVLEASTSSDCGGRVQKLDKQVERLYHEKGIVNGVTSSLEDSVECINDQRGEHREAMIFLAKHSSRA